MTAPKVLLSQKDETGASPLGPAPEMSWQVLGGAGFAFLLIGGIDIVLTWLPLLLGNAEWEFGTITASLNNLPLSVMGLVLVMVSAIARGRRRTVRVVAVMFAMLALGIVASAVLYATDIPIALQAMTSPIARIGLGKAMIKTLSQLVGYPVLFTWLAVRGWKHSRTA